VKTFCAKVAGHLHTFDFDEKRLALKALQVKIVVGKSGARLQGAIPTNLATIEQTLGCMFNSDQKLSRVPFNIQAVCASKHLTLHGRYILFPPETVPNRFNGT
jgi:hypothetical protein